MFRIKEQFKRHKEQTEEEFAKDAPRVQESIKKIKTPLIFGDIRKIYSALVRKQISLEMIDEKVLDEFKKTRQYEKILRDNNSK